MLSLLMFMKPVVVETLRPRTRHWAFIIFNLKLLLRSGEIPRQVGALSLGEKFMGVKIFAVCKQFPMPSALTGYKL